MTRKWRKLILLLLPGCLGPFVASGQIDPTARQLFQVGYNLSLQGHAPLAAYGFYYWNQPEFINTNMALRLAIAPVYLDSELGLRHVLGENTDLGIDVAGGGFADSYKEIRHGTYLPSESFTGHGGEAGLSLYHLFNPGQMIPLYGILRGTMHYTAYERDDETARDFQLPEDRGSFNVRTGLRWGGSEPLLYPDLAMEVAVWYEGHFRTVSDTYGFGDRSVEPQSHLFYADALLAYTFPESKHSFYLKLTAGASLEADRFSAYRLGALLPFVSEVPLSLPGYYYQELSAERFVLLGGNYLLPLDARQRWNVNFTAATAVVDYLPGLEQPGNWHNSLGVGMLYHSPSWKILLGYAHGFEAIRTHGRGADSIGVLMQFDWKRARGELFNPEQPYRWRGLQNVLDFLGL